MNHSFKVLRFLAKDIFNSLGFEVRRVPRASEVASGQVVTGDPLTFQYMPRKRNAAVMNIDLADCRGLASLGLPLQSESHPIVMAAIAAMNSDTDRNAAAAVSAILQRYYSQVCPSTALEAVDLDEKQAPGLAGHSATSWLAPWSDKGIAEVLNGRELAVGMDALQYGKRIPFSDGITAFGPLGEAKFSLEVDRLCKLVKSIRTKGIIAFDRKNPVKVRPLRREGVYRWQIEAGHHRFAAFAASERKSLPAVILDVIRREDSLYWPQVVAGTFTNQGALAYFDRIYDGVPASVCGPWLASAGQAERSNQRRMPDDPEREQLA